LKASLKMLIEVGNRSFNLFCCCDERISNFLTDSKERSISCSAVLVFLLGSFELFLDSDFCSRSVQDPDFRTRARQDSAHFQQTGSDPD